MRSVLILQKVNIPKKILIFSVVCLQILNLVVCLLGGLHHRHPCLNCPGDYILTLLSTFLYYPLERIAFMASIICDVLLILSRLVLLFNKRTNVFCTLSRKVNNFFGSSCLKLKLRNLGFFFKG